MRPARRSHIGFVKNFGLPCLTVAIASAHPGLFAPCARNRGAISVLSTLGYVCCSPHLYRRYEPDYPIPRCADPCSCNDVIFMGIVLSFEAKAGERDDVIVKVTANYKRPLDYTTFAFSFIGRDPFASWAEDSQSRTVSLAFLSESRDMAKRFASLDHCPARYVGRAK